METDVTGFKGSKSKSIGTIGDIVDKQAKLKNDLKDVIQTERQFVEEGIKQIKNLKDSIMANWKTIVPAASLETAVGVGYLLMKKGPVKAGLRTAVKSTKKH